MSYKFVYHVTEIGLNIAGIWLFLLSIMLILRSCREFLKGAFINRAFYTS